MLRPRDTTRRMILEREVGMSNSLLAVCELQFPRDAVNVIIVDFQFHLDSFRLHLNHFFSILNKRVLSVCNPHDTGASTRRELNLYPTKYWSQFSIFHGKHFSHFPRLLSLFGVFSLLFIISARCCTKCSRKTPSVPTQSSMPVLHNTLLHTHLSCRAYHPSSFLLSIQHAPTQPQQALCQPSRSVCEKKVTQQHIYYPKCEALHSDFTDTSTQSPHPPLS